MWQYFTVKSFRCLSVQLENLARVNLIAGKNNTGKTALLEAMHIHTYPQDCTVPFMINTERNLKDVPPYSEEVASWLFRDRYARGGLELSSWEDKGSRTLTIYLLDAAATMQHHPEAEQMLQRSFVEESRHPHLPRLIMKTQVSGKETYAIAVPTGTGLAMVGNAAPWDGASVFVSSAGRDLATDTMSFSELAGAKREEELLPSLQVLEPRLKKLSVLFLGGASVIHGDVGLSRLVPVPMMGEGIRRLLSILLAIASAAGGRVLIDEVENGLHYSVLKDVWKAIGAAARQYDVQVFGTTHSYECVAAAQAAFADTDDLRLFRLDRINDQLRVASYTKETLATSMDMNLEVR